MASRNIKKGITGLEAIIITGIIGGGTLLGMVMIPFILRVHLLVLVTSLYEYNNAQLSLLTLLSLQNKTTLYQNISTHILMNKPQNTEFIKEKMDLISDCYKLYTLSKDLASKIPEGCDLRYKAEALIVLPYNPSKLVERIMLEIG
ncbi:MAG: hypothetical protein QW609_02230 [Candidatus Aenigmatarchaeota archaeon]